MSRKKTVNWLLCLVLICSMVLSGAEVSAEEASDTESVTEEVTEISGTPVPEEEEIPEAVTETPVTMEESVPEEKTEASEADEETEETAEVIPEETVLSEEKSVPEKKENNEQAVVNEDAEKDAALYAETDPSLFTVADNGDNTVTIKKYTGKDKNVIVPSLIDGKTVTAIGDYAFQSNYDIESVVLPDTVVTLGQVVFGSSSKLESVTLPGGITEIGDRWFESCSSLKSITIPDNVTSIGRMAFERCSSLKEINFGQKISSIGDRAFYGCTSLESIVVPNSVTSLGSYTFYECTSLANVTLSEKITVLPDYLFYHCTSLQGCVFSEKVTSIGTSAFAGCTGLTYIKIPSSATNISSNAFKGCTGLKTIGPVDSGSNIEISFGQTLTKSYRLAGLFENVTSVTVPAGVTGIGADAFNGLYQLEEVNLPEGVTSIGTNAFFNCTSLTHVVIPGSAQTMGNKIFYGCPQLKTAGSIGSGANIEFGYTGSLPYGVFYQANYLESAVIPDSITSIGESVFSGCTSLTSVELPDTLTSIGMQAFRLCTSLPEISIPDSVSYMGKETFEDCTGLKKVKLSKNVTGFGDSTFQNCSSLKSIVLPEGFTGMGASIFKDCSSLENVYLPESLTDMMAAVFEDCISLSSIALPSNLSMAGYTFRGCTNLKKVVWPIGNTSIPAYTFEDCTSLTDINLEHISYFGESAFKNCTSLEEVNAENVYRMDSGAFEGCTSLKKFSMYESNYMDPSSEYTSSRIDYSVFKDCTSLKDVYISLPGNVSKTIRNSAFMNCPDGMNIHFFGTPSDWAKVTIESNNDSLAKANIIYEASPSSITISSKEIEIGKGQSLQLNYSVSPSDYPKAYLMWRSYDPEIVSVDENGIITSHAAGDTTITVSAPNSGAYAYCKVTVGTVRVKGVSITPETDQVSVGNTIDLDEVLTPENAENRKVTWSSSDSSIATVDQNGIVRGLKVGNVTITVKTDDGGHTASRNISVVQPVTGVAVSETELRLAINDTHQLNAVVTPEDAGNKNVSWTSDHKDIVSVDENGTIKALKEGTAVITVTTEDGGFTAECTVTAYTVHPERISIDETESAERIEIGRTGTIKIIFEPANTTNQNVQWSSDNEKVAAVDETGTVTAVTEGTVTITATSEDGGLTASRQITVYMIHVDSVSFRKDELTTAVGKTVKAETVIQPANATKQDVTYTTDHPEIAEVSEDGTITGVSVGTAVITAVTVDGSKTAVCSVTVFPRDFTVGEVEDSYPYTGTAIKPVPEVYDNGILLTEGKDYTVSYKNNTAAKEVPEGLDREHFVPDKTEGTDKYPYILVTGKGNYSGKVYVPFSITQADLSDSEQVYAEESIILKANNKVQRPVPVITFNGKAVSSKEYTLTYLDEEGTELDKKTGPKEAGTYKIHIEGNNKNFTGEKDITLTISETEETAKLKTVALSKAVTVKAVPEVYDGTEHENAVVESKAGYELEEDNDYTIAYTKNVNVGTATVTVTGKGIYTGSVKKTFKITPAVYNEEDFDIEVSDAVYSKGGGIPEVTVTWNGTELVERTDFTLKYTGNKKVGDDTAAAKITFKGNYKGSTSEPYSITPKDLSEVTITAKDLVYKKGKYKSTPILTDSDGKKLKAGTDYDKVYEYTYSNGDPIEGDVPAGSEVTVTVHAKGNNYEGDTSYTYKILEAENNLSSAAVQFKDSEGNTVKSIAKDYTGEEVTLEKEELVVTMKVKENGKTVTVTVDPENYEIAGYTNNINKGTAKVTIRGIGAYGGEKTVSFKIIQRSIAEYWNGVRQFFGRTY